MRRYWRRLPRVSREHNCIISEMYYIEVHGKSTRELQIGIYSSDKIQIDELRSKNSRTWNDSSRMKLSYLSFLLFLLSWSLLFLFPVIFCFLCPDHNHLDCFQRVSSSNTMPPHFRFTPTSSAYVLERDLALNWRSRATMILSLQ